MLKDLPTIFIQHVLAINPASTSFPWSNHGHGADVSRAALQTELNSRAPVQNTVMGPDIGKMPVRAPASGEDAHITAARKWYKDHGLVWK
jgi:hypothetical protein